MKTTVIKTHTTRTDEGPYYAYHFEQLIKIQPDSGSSEVHVFQIVISLTHTEVYPHSFGEVSRWDGSRWSTVASLNHDELKVLKITSSFNFRDNYDEEGLNIMFGPDRDELLRLALEVCTNIDISQI